MAQLSRPYQIGLVAVALLAAAWLLLFQGHHSSTSGPGSAQAPVTATHTVPAHTPAPKAHAEGTAGQATGHGSASSLGALGHSVEQARGAVSTSQRNANELANKSAQASSPAAPSSSSPATGAGAAGGASHAQSAAPSTSSTHAQSAAPSTSSSAGTAIHAAPKSASPAKGTIRAAVALRQHAVEAQLAQGKTVLIFFWNPKGSDDRAVNRELGKLPHDLRIAVDRARSNAVATFGTITRGVQVYGTPTLLIVNKKGQVSTMTGLQSTFTIAQAIRESKKR
jgi:hypothetical protein